MAFGGSLHVDLSAELEDRVFPTYSAPLGPIPQSSSWQDVLLKVIETPEKYEDHIFMQTLKFVVMYDGYPKANNHLLIVPRQKILTPNALNVGHLDLLKDARRLAQWIVQRLRAKSPHLTFACGMHTIASLHQVHFHVISQDFDSERVKHAKHWLSFNSPFFAPLSLLIEQLEGHANRKGWGSLAPPLEFPPARYEPYLKGPLRCNRTGCGRDFGREFKKFQQHYLSCTLPLPPNRGLDEPSRGKSAASSPSGEPALKKKKTGAEGEAANEGAKSISTAAAAAAAPAAPAGGDDGGGGDSAVAGGGGGEEAKPGEKQDGP
ncbi:unnamed protein product [Vitrella brassicaformis CCMP3155]|uniref:HIT domain-containing protein n=2 Tax=Vitrella brassicaformis TaxID=1169539 RepID=A0A0G4EH58_VITBC|nr:unnamed protein product [Vitrella brassicaformis CCMP3155]|eukprot:CEL95150.1 unnamed protein product [Vitrella brassicaformis CCMP3155]